jgi:hypothetical protein
MKSTMSVFAASLMLLCLGRVASGDYIPNAIQGVTAWAGSPGDSSATKYEPQEVVDGDGLTLATSGTYAGQYVHDTVWANGWQTYSNSVTSNWLLMDLGAAYTNLSQASVWNVKEFVDRGAKDVSIYYATSPTTIPSKGDSFDFSTASEWTLFENTTIAEATTNSSATPVDTVIDLSGIASARYLVFVINSNYGSTTKYGGFAEIQITTVPEPSATVLTVIGVGGFLAFAWRKRKLNRLTSLKTSIH